MNVIDVKKETELLVLAAARSACSIFPSGEVTVGESPDFRIAGETGIVGVELSRVLPPPRNSSFNSPLAEESLHQDVTRLAEEYYYRTPGATPVKVTVYFWDVERSRNGKREMAQALSAFVMSHRQQANPVATFDRHDEIPDGFGVISIVSDAGTWFCGESVGNSVSGIHRELSTRIAVKNSRVPNYRVNLPDSPIWLLLHSGIAVPESVPIPWGIADWTFEFDFDRVFWLDCLMSKVVELRQTAHDG